MNKHATIPTILRSYLCGILLFSSAALVHAQDTPKPPIGYTPLAPLPCIEVSGSDCVVAGGETSKVYFQNYVQTAFNFAIYISAAAAILMIVYGGLKYMTTDSWGGKKEGISTIKNALYGLLLVLTSYIILRTIDPRLVAIPTTLVKPLDLDFTKVDILGSVVGDADRFKADMAAFRSEISQAQSESMDLQAKIYAVDVRIRSLSGANLTGAEIAAICKGVKTTDPADLVQACKERDGLVAKKFETDGNMNMNKAQGIMRAEVYKCDADSKPGCFDGKGAAIDTYFQKYSSQMTPAQRALLTQYALYSQSVIFMMGNMAEIKERGVVGPSYKEGSWGEKIRTAMNTFNTAVKTYSTLPGADRKLAEQMRSDLAYYVKTVNGWPGWGAWKLQ